MYTQCPECLAIYALDPSTVAQAGGRVGCGQCGASFDALRTLTKALPAGDFDTLPAHPGSPVPPILMLAVVHDAPGQAAGFADAADTADAFACAPEARTGALLTEAQDDAADAPQQPTITAAPGAPVESDDAADTDPTPTFARHRHPAPPPRRGRWLAACAVLTLTLAAQLGWAERVPLTANAQTRPWLQQVCRWFGCRLPLVRDVGALQLLSRDVRPHPTTAGALLISATVRNTAPFAQPYPVVAITLSDLDGNRIAMRRFRPTVYLTDPAVRAAGLAPGATAALVFEVADPGHDAVAFRFGFQ